MSKRSNAVAAAAMLAIAASASLANADATTDLAANILSATSTNPGAAGHYGNDNVNVAVMGGVTAQTGSWSASYVYDNQNGTAANSLATYATNESGAFYTAVGTTSRDTGGAGTVSLFATTSEQNPQGAQENAFSNMGSPSGGVTAGVNSTTVAPYTVSNGLPNTQWTAEDLNRGYVPTVNSIAAGVPVVFGANFATLPSAGFSVGPADYGRPTGYVQLTITGSQTYLVGTVATHPSVGVIFGLQNRDETAVDQSGGAGAYVAGPLQTPHLYVSYALNGDGSIDHPPAGTPELGQTLFTNTTYSTQASLENQEIQVMLADVGGNPTIDFTVGGVSVIGGPQSIALNPAFLSATSLSYTLQLMTDHGNLNHDAAFMFDNSVIDGTASPTGNPDYEGYDSSADSQPSSLARINSLTYGSVPEPASLSLMALGGLGLLRRRRRARA